MGKKFVLSFLVIIFVSGSIQISNAFVERKYSLQEVINECTNIVFGTLTNVDAKRQRAVVKVEENLKGKSKFDHIKINVAVGQRRPKTSPEKFMKSLKVGNPVIIFYRHNGANLGALGHTGGTWFQTKTNIPPNQKDVWWGFTHIEIFMHRTFKGSTEDFQQLLLRTLKPFEYATPNDIRVLAFTKYRANNEFNTLSSFKKIANKDVFYKSVQTFNSSDLDKADILWIGYRSVSEIHTGKYLFNNGAEDKIKQFVKDGGIVILSGQDSDPNRSCETGFLPESIKGVEGKVGNGIKFVQNDDLFKIPESIKPEEIRVDDAWSEASRNYSVLAYTNEGYIALAKLNYGRGMYIITAMQNGKPAHLKTNSSLMKNLLYQAVEMRL